MIKNLISVIIPIWRPNISHLKICLDSLINQTYSNIEIIIAYSKSLDFDEGFYKLMTEFNDERIKIIESPKRGLSIQTNNAIAQSSGEFIGRIDADDFCSLERFERQLDYKKKNKIDVLGTWGIYVNKNGKEIGKIELPLTHNELRKKMMEHVPVMGGAVLIDSKMLDDIGLYDTSISSSVDYELWFRAMSKGYSFGNMPEYLVTIRENPDSVTRDKWRKHRLAMMKVRKKALRQYGFRKPRDIFYFILTPLHYFVSPKTAMKARQMLGTYKK